MSNTWIDIGVVRIQRYLSRTDRLVGRRAGSALLTDVMRSPEVVDYIQSTVIGHDISTHVQGGDSDGVLHLVVSGQIDDETVQELVRTALKELRRLLPGADLEATWAHGDTYAAASAGLAERRNASRSVRSSPPIATIPFARRCELSGVDIAIGTRRLNQTDRALGLDAMARLTHEEGRRASGDARGAHHRLVSVAELEPPRDLTAVAASVAGSSRRDIGRGSNHLATLFIDGNAMGSFFSSVAVTPGAGRDALSAEATAAMLEAVDTAMFDLSRMATDDPDVAPFEVHVLGGDDVLLTVPGPYGLEAGRRIIDTFSGRMRDAVAQHAPSLIDLAPTASAGVVIAHQSYPISTVIDVATELLAAAKRGTQGRSASLAWTDITRYGHRIDDRKSLTLEDLAALSPDVERIRELGKSARTVLAQAVQHPVPAVAQARAFNELHRRHRADLAHLADDPERLSTLLDLAQWWFQ